jgi:ribosomal protein S24E
MEIIKQIDNALFNRKEIIIKIENESSPKTSEVAQTLSEKFSSPIEGVKIKSIKGNFGSNIFVISANLYSSKEDLDLTETKSKKLRDAEKKAAEEEKKKAEEAAKQVNTSESTQ